MRTIWSLILVSVFPLAWGQSDLPDERVLWQLLNADRLPLLRQAIEEYRRRHPGWEPPAALVEELRRRQHRQHAKSPEDRIAAAIRRQDWPRLIRLARRHPPLFDCHHPGRLQALALALAYGNTGDVEAAFRLYRRLLGCSGVDAEAVLEQAFWQLPTMRFEALLEHARERLSVAARQRLRYRLQRRRLIDHHRRREFVAFERLAERMAADIEAHRELDLVRLIAWTAHDRKNWQSAVRWFEMGLALAPEDESLAYGLALAYRQLRRDQDLLRLAERFPQSARIRQLAGGYLLGEAWQAYHRNDFDDAGRLARQALALLGRQADVEHLLGWIALKTGRFEEARRRFERLQRSHPDDRRYAEALVLAYRHSGVDLRRLLESPSPLVRSIARERLAQRHYHQKRFLSAYHLDPPRFPPLSNIDAPSIGTAALYRIRSGTGGLDRLETLIVPTFAGTYVTGNQRFTLTLGRVGLSSGKLNPTAVSRLTADPVLQNRLRENPPAHAVNGAWIEFSYQGEGPGRPFFSAGLTPVNHRIAPRPTFRLGFQDQDDATHAAWRIESYSQPVRQSLLSYTGRWAGIGECFSNWTSPSSTADGPKTTGPSITPWRPPGAWKRRDSTASAPDPTSTFNTTATIKIISAWVTAAISARSASTPQAGDSICAPGKAVPSSSKGDWHSASNTSTNARNPGSPSVAPTIPARLGNTRATAIRKPPPTCVSAWSVRSIPTFRSAAGCTPE